MLYNVFFFLVYSGLGLLRKHGCALWQDAASIARMEDEPEAAARKLTETAFTRGSADNITCIVVKFHHSKADPDESQHE